MYCVLVILGTAHPHVVQQLMSITEPNARCYSDMLDSINGSVSERFCPTKCEFAVSVSAGPDVGPFASGMGARQRPPYMSMLIIFPFGAGFSTNE